MSEERIRIKRVRIAKAHMIDNPDPERRARNPYVMRLELAEHYFHNEKYERWSIDVTMAYYRRYTDLQDLVLRNFGVLLYYKEMEDLTSRPADQSAAWRELTNEFLTERNERRSDGEKES